VAPTSIPIYCCAMVANVVTMCTAFGRNSSKFPIENGSAPSTWRKLPELRAVRCAKSKTMICGTAANVWEIFIRHARRNGKANARDDGYVIFALRSRTKMGRSMGILLSVGRLSGKKTGEKYETTLENDRKTELFNQKLDKTGFWILELVCANFCLRTIVEEWQRNWLKDL